MCFFEKRPYKLNNFSGAEKAAMEGALEIGIRLASGDIQKKLEHAHKNVRRGSLTRTDLICTSACVKGTLEAMTKGDDSDMRSTLLKQKGVVQAVLAIALAKLEVML